MNERSERTVQSVDQHAGAMTASTTVPPGETSGEAAVTDHGIPGLFEDLETLIRRHPLQAILLGGGMGYVIGRYGTR